VIGDQWGGCSQHLNVIGNQRDLTKTSKQEEDWRKRFMMDQEGSDGMAGQARNLSRRWSIVMAGSEGECVQPFIQRWFGHSKPKQYCTFVGTRSLFQHTLDRAARLSRSERIVTVIPREHRPEAWSQLEGRAVGTVLLQPKNRDTAAGVFLSLTYIRARDPQAIVVIYPSDHFVYPEERFLELVQRAAWTAEWLPDRLIYLGVPPDGLELDYGWIMPGEKLDGSPKYQIRAVDSFLEQPTAAQADAALAKGALWNTSVLVAKAPLLWELGWQCFPDMMPHFERLSDSIGTSQEVRTLDEMYRDMPAHNFSSELLRQVPDQVAVIEMNGVLWSDWGKPERIVRTLRRIGRQPAFPLACLSHPFVPISLVEAENGVLADV
jgi:mannose-1-phosphate guanylyltransferase